MNVNFFFFKYGQRLLQNQNGYYQSIKPEQRQLMTSFNL